MTRIFSDFVSSYPDTPIFRTAIALVRNGYAIIPVEPGGKAPLCTLTSRERNAAVREFGGHGAGFPASPCGVYHFITDAKIAERVFKRLGKEMGREPNVGIVAHPSRLLVVDVDTPDAVNAFLSRCAQAEEDQGYLTRGPTVSTPGSRHGEEWRHHHGGHYYFNIPDGIELPTSPGQVTLPGGVDVRWGMLMTVAPPSTRPEGAYIVHGDVPELLPWLLHEARSHIGRHTARVTELTTRFINDDVVQWSLRTEWPELLAPCGWTDTNKVDSCGCPIWEKPGGGSTGPKSATAHEGTCQVMQNVEGHGALHLWTTDPPPELAGRSNLTKLQFYALMHHAGDEAAAEVELGLVPDYETLWDTSGQPVSSGEAYAPEDVAGRPDEPPQGDDQAEQPTEQPAPTADKVASDKHQLSKAARHVADVTGMSYKQAHEIVGDVWARREAKTAVDAYFGPETFDGSSWLPRGQEEMLRSVRRDRAEKAEGILERTDGATLFPLGKLHELFGQSSAGKTFLMMIAMHQQVAAGHRCLYVDFEDTLDTFIDRYIIDLGIDIVPFIEAGLLCYANPIEPPGDLTPLIDLDFRLVVVDSLSEVVSATADGSLKDGVLIKRIFGNFRKMAVAGASVVIIAHGSEKVDVPGTSLGASEIRQSLTGQDVLLQERKPFDSKTVGHSLIYIAKDRGSHAGGDTDMNERAINKVTRRLWGAMVVEPKPPEELLGETAWHTEIKIEKMTHVDTEPPKVTAIDVAEQLIITYLRDRPEPKREEDTTDEQFELRRQTARQADMTDDLVDEESQKERTVRRAVKKLIEDGMIHIIATEAPPTGGTPSPVLKLGPAPEKPTEPPKAEEPEHPA